MSLHAQHLQFLPVSPAPRPFAQHPGASLCHHAVSESLPSFRHQFSRCPFSPWLPSSYSIPHSSDCSNPTARSSVASGDYSAYPWAAHMRYASAHRLLFRQNILLLPAHQLHRHPGSHPHPLYLCALLLLLSPLTYISSLASVGTWLMQHVAAVLASITQATHTALPAYQSVAGCQHRPSPSVAPSVDASLSGSRIWLPGPCQMEPDKGKNLQDSPFSCITF